jgi:hypothetical protein
MLIFKQLIQFLFQFSVRIVDISTTVYQPPQPLLPLKISQAALDLVGKHAQYGKYPVDKTVRIGPYNYRAPIESEFYC